MSETSSTTREENDRQYDVLDQTLTMHSSYRDRMERRAFWLNTALIALSFFLCVFAFIGDSVLAALGLAPDMTRFVLGIVAVFVLICSVTEFRVDWRSIAGRHAEAASRLAELKAKYRKSFDETGGHDQTKNAELTSEYNKAMSGLPQIPERYFNSLKAEHRFKRLLSERISRCPKAPLWFLRLRLRWEGIRESMRVQEERQDDQHQNPGQTDPGDGACLDIPDRQGTGN